MKRIDTYLKEIRYRDENLRVFGNLDIESLSFKWFVVVYLSFRRFCFDRGLVYFLGLGFLLVLICAFLDNI